MTLPSVAYPTLRPISVANPTLIRVANATLSPISVANPTLIRVANPTLNPPLRRLSDACGSKFF